MISQLAHFNTYAQGRFKRLIHNRKLNIQPWLDKGLPQDIFLWWCNIYEGSAQAHEHSLVFRALEEQKVLNPDWIDFIDNLILEDLEAR